MKVNAKCSPESLMQCYRKLEDYRKKELPTKVEKTMGDIGERFTSVASDAFGAGVMFYSKKVGNFAYEISATSLTDQLITFLEFGTGLYADASHKYVSMVDYNVYPGSWSENHANTWYEWINAGNDPKKYPYNKQPRRGVYLGMEAARRYLKSMAQRAK